MEKQISHKLFVVIIVTLMLCITEIVFRFILYETVRSDDFVFTPLRSSMIDVYVEHQPQTEGTVVVTLGDSTNSIVSTNNPLDTLVVQFEKKLKARMPDQPFTHYRMAMPGSKVFNNYFFWKRFESRRVDLLILPINYELFSPREIYSDRGILPEGRFLGELDLAQLPGLNFQPDLNTRLGWGVGRVCKLYGHSDLLIEMLFSKPPGTLITGNWSLFMQAVRERMTGVKVDDDPLFPGGYLPLMKKAYRVRAFDESNISYLALRELLRSCKKRGVPILTYLVPVNWELNNRYQVFDPTEYWKNIDVLDAGLNEIGVELVQISGLSNDDFHDLHHLRPSGCEVTAKLLAEKAQSILSEKR